MNLIRVLSPLRRDRRSAIAVIFALAGMTLFTMVALGMDFSGAVGAKSKLALAADAALLETEAAATNAFKAEPAASFNPAIADGIRRFWAHVGTLPGTTVHPPVITVTRVGTSFTAAIDYSADYSTSFAGLLGATSIPLSGHSEAVTLIGGYNDLQVLIDTSSSMLIAATDADSTAMIAASQHGRFADPAPSWWASGCAFACHWDPGNNDFYQASRDNHITLRLDQIKVAVATMIGSVDARNSLNQFRFGLFTFNTDIANTDTVGNLPVAANVAGEIPILNAIVPPLGDPWHAYNTNITQSVLNFATRYLSVSGDGTSAVAPRKFVFLLTDGIDDVFAAGYPSSRRESAMNPASCDALKAKGATVAVMHTLYINPANEFAEITAIQPAVVAALQNCASRPDLYFPVADQTQINTAVAEMLNAVVATSTRFTH